MARPPLEIGTAGNMKTVEVVKKDKKKVYRTRANFRDADGETRKVERWGKSKADAERRMKTALKERSHSEVGEELTEESTIAALLPTWWKLKQVEVDDLSDGTKASYEDIMTRILIPGLGGVRIREVTTKKLDVWLLQEQLDRPAQADLSRTILRQSFDLAVRWDLCKANPARSVAKFKKKVNDPRGLTTEELTRWRDQLRNVRQNLWIADAAEVQLGMGLRIGEVLAIKVDALNLDHPEGPRVNVWATVITPNGKPHSWQAHTKDGPKGRRTVIVPDWVAEILGRRALLAGPSGLVLATRNDTLLSPRNFREAWRRERRRAGMDWLRPHNLRKTALTKVSTVYGNETASKFADHKTVAITEAHYIEATENVGPDVRPALEELAPPAPERHLTLVEKAAS